jgi:penicillin-binding protein 1A
LQQAARTALEQGLEALDRRQGWRGPLQSHDGSGDIEALLVSHESGMRDNHFAAIVTEVTKDQAQIRLRDGQRGRIPFRLAFWAYPPRDEDGVRPQPLADLRDALAIGDIVMVQPPGATPDLIRDGFEPEQEDWSLSQRPLVEGAIVALDPHTGRLLAMSGGYNYRDSEFNRAVQALRQPGSAFKPFVYLAALDQGYNPTTRILDAPLVVDQGQGKPKWKPANYTRRFYGPSIMRVGIEKSRNLMTARLAMNLGMDEIQEYARRFGLNDDLPPLLSMSLGAGETTLLRLTAAYGMLVNGGKKITPSLIDRVQDRHGKTIYRHDQRDCKGCTDENGWSGQPIPDLADIRPQLTEPASAFQMVSMLEGVIKRGTGRRIDSLELVVAGKTGTTNDNTNGWFIGFTPDLAVGVFVGYDTPRALGKRETGSTVAVPIFGNFIAAASAGKPVIPFRRPSGVTIIPVHAETGERVLPDHEKAIFEVFKPGQRPGGALIDVPGSSARGADDEEITIPGLF